MAKRKSRRRKPSGRSPGKLPREGNAPPHGDLTDNVVHVFVDDQNLFWGIVNREYGPGFRIDFGELLIELSRDKSGNTRPVKSAYIAGVIPDDDSFWEIAEKQGFTVKRGYLGTNSRSKQDDAYLITEITATVYEQEGPSTIVVAAGDADYVPPLSKALDKGWRTEVGFISTGVSSALVPVVHEFRQLYPPDIQYNPIQRI